MEKLKGLKPIIKVLILFIVLGIISITVILIKGNEYVYKSDNIKELKSIDEVKISIEDENIVKCVDKKIEDGKVVIKLKSENKGKTYMILDYLNNDADKMFSIYVHNFGIISFNEFMGDVNGIKIIPICFLIFLLYIIYLLIISYRKSVKENMYQYKNIAYLGIIVFLFFVVISQIFTFYNYRGIITTVNQLSSFFSFSIVLLPIAFVVSILVIISNISLVRKEGFNIRNILGIILGVFLCFMTLLPNFLYTLLYSATWIDIHNQNGIGLYLYNFVEALINIISVYIECVLIGTIIMGIKAARHVPSFDKDAIIILGCQIKKDGTLTNLLKGRVDRAIEFSKLQKEKIGKDIYFVPSGGKGEDEVISEADAMNNYLLDQGINKNKIIVENKSKNTYENVKFSNKLINEKIQNAKIAFSTTNYHVFRAGCIATNQTINMEGIGAKTKSYFWINAFIREFIATLYNEKKKHIIVLLGIILFSILIILITFLNNNI